MNPPLYTFAAQSAHSHRLMSVIPMARMHAPPMHVVGHRHARTPAPLSPVGHRFCWQSKVGPSLPSPGLWTKVGGPRDVAGALLLVLLASSIAQAGNYSSALCLLAIVALHFDYNGGGGMGFMLKRVDSLLRLARRGWTCVWWWMSLVWRLKVEAHRVDEWRDESENDEITSSEIIRRLGSQ
jgi:hypothetical protein